MKNATEAYLNLNNVETALYLVVGKFAADGVTTSRKDRDFLVEFESARVTMRPLSGVLCLRVESDEDAICRGAEMLVQATIAEFAEDMPTHVLWVAAGSEPFTTFAHF